MVILILTTAETNPPGPPFFSGGRFFLHLAVKASAFMGCYDGTVTPRMGCKEGEEGVSLWITMSSMF